MSQCRSCGAEVQWVKSAVSGKTMILDAEPCVQGNVVLGRRSGELVAVVYSGSIHSEEVHPGKPRYLDHHATCKKVSEWR